MNKITKMIIKNILKLFYIFPIKENKIFITNFGGKESYGFDARAIVEYSNNNNLGYKFYWGVNRNDFNLQKHKNVEYVKINSLKGVFLLCTCGIFITNINPPSYIPFRKKQLLINTWHGGGAFKKCGKYIDGFDKKQFNSSNCFLSDSTKGTELIMRDSFEYLGEVLEIGFPRNDIFFDLEHKQLVIEKLRRDYNIPRSNKVLLYEPTFRGNFELDENTIDFKKVKESLSKKFNCDWTIMYRLHPLISQKYKIDIEDAIDVSLHEDNQELLCIADVLITDYSSCMWDYSLQYKPVIIYAEDIDKYEKERGLYISYKDWPYLISKNNDELCKKIMNYDNNKYNQNLERFFDYMGLYERGTACKEMFEYIERQKNKNIAIIAASGSDS